MTNVLVLGGTGWLSSRIAAGWVARGAEVTCLARGTRPAPGGARLHRADRALPDAYTGLDDRDWDEVVDVSSDAVAVAAAIAALADRAAHWTYVSSVSVYADAGVPDADESAPLVPPAVEGDDDYARAKAAAEQAVRRLDGRAAIIRPGLIVGPGDPSDRFGYWPARFALAGAEPVLAPAAPGGRVQVIDVDDLAAFAVDAGARGWSDIADAVGDSWPLADVLALARRLAGHTGDVVEADPDWLVDHDVASWAGPRSLPLWLPDDMPGFAARRGERYRAAGGGIRPLAETMQRVLDDEIARGVDRERRSGLRRADEIALLAQR